MGIRPFRVSGLGRNLAGGGGGRSRGISTLGELDSLAQKKCLALAQLPPPPTLPDSRPSLRSVRVAPRWQKLTSWGLLRVLPTSGLHRRKTSSDSNPRGPTPAPNIWARCDCRGYHELAGNDCSWYNGGFTMRPEVRIPVGTPLSLIAQVIS